MQYAWNLRRTAHLDCAHSTWSDHGHDHIFVPFETASQAAYRRRNRVCARVGCNRTDIGGSHVNTLRDGDIDNQVRIVDFCRACNLIYDEWIPLKAEYDYVLLALANPKLTCKRPVLPAASLPKASRPVPPISLLPRASQSRAPILPSATRPSPLVEALLENRRTRRFRP